ncbi:serine hydrolase domain-containing protein [Atopomonas sediminilitoris]|uniref:serine hydrolase domain-containing protein n=1 Tax=Atopomonas sediminilitoris TaxID=2919919 RepID=UPI001F4D5BE5|nr:serine hydrolase [Atopomonas sediminilitoris]MCJ8168696.1 beta-lactamase family protein [Atopomonas sediminilitoris]
MRALLHCTLLLASLVTSAVSAEERWPVPEWVVALPVAAERVQALQAYAFPERDDAARTGVRTDALLVIKDGEIVYERYAGENSAQTPHLLWSVSKSVWATVLGVAQQQGVLSLDQSVSEHYPPLKAHPQITYRHLLHWASGLDWAEDYEYAPLKSSVVAMLYTRGRQDMAAFTAAHPQGVKPGIRHSYSSGDSNLLGAALKQPLAERYADYPWEALFNPLGMRHVSFEADASGTYVASSYAYMTARDLARLGLLMQRDGRWQDQQLLAPEWVKFNRTLFEHATQTQPAEALPGGHWWLNAELQGQRAWPDAPTDAFAGLGHWGQSLTVLPSDGLIVVRYADDRDGSYQHNTLLRHVRAAFAAAKP